MASTDSLPRPNLNLKTFTQDVPIIRGDVWLQNINFYQLGRDWTGLVCEPSLWQGETMVEGVTPSGDVTVGTLGYVSVLLGLTDVQTQGLQPGGYAVRCRLVIPSSWGPYTPAAVAFRLIT